MHYSLAAWGLIEMVLIYLYLPETSHKYSARSREHTTPFNFVWINPFSGLWLLRSPNIMAVVCCFSSHYALPQFMSLDAGKYISDGYGVWYVENVNNMSQTNLSTSSIDPNRLHNREVSVLFSPPDL